MKNIILLILLVSPAALFPQAPGCPNIQVSNETVSCDTPCVDLVATYLQTGETTSYSVSSTTYTPPYPFLGGTQLFIGIDDIWSSIITLPFDFCFFGNTYDQIIVGANGVISFDVSNAGGWCEWQFSNTIPNTSIPYPNSINGAYHDLDPSISGGDINYAVLGTYPCRTFVVNYASVPHFSCNNISTTQQIVLYETTNVIEVYIEDKPTCSSWNSGNAVIGIQNVSGTIGYTPPNRNTSLWNASNEAWRFTPDGNPNYIVEWFDVLGNSLGFGDTLNVCTQTQENYTASITYNNCNGSFITESVTNTVFINNNISITNSISSNPACNASDGSIDITVSGGTTPYTYLWEDSLSPGVIISTTSLVTGLSSGTYNLEVTDALGCQIFETIVLVEDLPPVFSLGNDSLIPCNSSILIDPIVLGGTLPYSFLWSSGDTTNNLITGSGIVILNVSDSFGCNSSDTIVLTDDLPPLVSLGPDLAIPCNSDTMITAVVSGGTAPYAYSWNTGNTTSNLALPSGVYIITVTDTNGCTNGDTLTIVDTLLTPNISLGSDLTVICNFDTLVTAIVSGGTSPYTYFWSTGNTANTDILGSGIYTLTITDASNCIDSDTISIITAPIVASPPPELECIWRDLDGTTILNWNHNALADSTTNYYIYGSYNIGGPYSLLSIVSYPGSTFLLTDSLFSTPFEYFYVANAHNCAPTSMPSDTVSPISFGITYTDVSCFGGSDGTIQVVVEDYINVLQYQYYLDGVLNINAHPLDTFFGGVSAGIHTVTVTNILGGCSVITPITISAPGFPLQALVSNSTNTCYGDDLGIAVGSSAGGTPGYSYEWFDSGWTSFSTNDTAFGLSAGSYYLEVMDANGCDTFTTVNVIEPQVPLTASSQVFNVACQGDSTAMIVGDASGSWAPYTYYWLDMNGDTLQSSPAHITTRDTLFDLTFGSYQLHIVDFQGCAVEYVLNIDEPLVALSIDSMRVIEPIACYGDSVGIARLYVSGGDPNYSYLWDNGETSVIAEELTSGYHSVLLTDDWGCELLDSIYVPENSLIESDLTADITVSCYGASDGVATISSFGGASNVYTYFWSTGQQTSGVNTDFADSLLHGSYYVTTRDALGCEVVDSIYISEPEPLSLEASELDWIDCFGYDNGLAFAEAQGGTDPYVFSWDNGQWIGDTVETLTPGLHTVVVTDSRGCTASDTIFTHEPTALYIEIDDLQTVFPYCMGVNTASLSAEAGGGTPSYTYAWDDNPVQPQTTTTASSLLADNAYSFDGSYTITVTDSKGCTASASTDTLQSFTETMVAFTISLSNFNGFEISCYGENDGQALVEADSGHAPYVYQWYGPNNFVSINDTIFNLLSGVYSVTVKDTNDCMVNTSIIITEPPLLEFTILGVTDESCFGACDGEIQVDVTGGVLPYTPITTNPASSLSTSVMIDSTNILNVCSGTYVLSFTDNNSCSSTLINGGVSTQTISTSETTLAQIDTGSTINILCNGTATGSLEALNPNLNTGYTYSWQDLNGNVVDTTVNAINLLAGTYVLHAAYNNTPGCTTTDTATVTELSIINPSAVVTDVDCYGNSSGILEGSAQGGAPPYTYLWNPGALSDSSINNLTSGIYTLSVTDSNNCQEVDTFEVTEPQLLTVTVSESNYVLTAAPIGGIFPYSYSWREQLQPFTEIGIGINYVVGSNGIYYVQVTDANGCPATSNSFEFNEVVTGVVALSTTIALNIYPNPFNEETTVDFGREIKDATIRIVDVYGKVIERHEVKDQKKHIIKRGNKASGVYFMEVEINNEYINNFKLVIE